MCKSSTRASRLNKELLIFLELSCSVDEGGLNCVCFCHFFVVFWETQFARTSQNSSNHLNSNRIQEISIMERASSTQSSGKTSGRRIYVNMTPSGKSHLYTMNRVRTSKYSLVTFLPKNMFEQFHGLANFYFLGIIILQILPEFKQVEIIVPLLPLVVILGVTAIKVNLSSLFHYFLCIYSDTTYGALSFPSNRMVSKT